MAVVRSPLARQVVALGLALSVVALSLAYPLRGYLQQQSAERQSVAEQHQLEGQISDLEAQISALKDPAYIRSEAKRRLQYVTPGDTVYVVKLPPSLIPAPATNPDNADLATATSPGEGVADPGTVGTGGATAKTTGPAPWYDSVWSTLRGSQG